jgi:hypothetical protein
LQEALELRRTRLERLRELSTMYQVMDDIKEELNQMMEKMLDADVPDPKTASAPVFPFSHQPLAPRMTPPQRYQLSFPELRQPCTFIRVRPTLCAEPSAPNPLRSLTLQLPACINCVHLHGTFAAPLLQLDITHPRKFYGPQTKNPQARENSLLFEVGLAC